MNSIPFVILVALLITQTKSQAGPDLAEADICSQDPKPGNCKADIKRYYFNTTASECLTFQFTGCGENENNFPTQEACIDTCLKRRATRRIPQDISYKMLSDFEWSAPTGSNIRRRFPLAFCDLERDIGLLCNGIRRGNYLEQFHYDSRSNRCSPFNYNGCGGNANRFATIWECTQSCVRKTVQQF